MTIYIYLVYACCGCVCVCVVLMFLNNHFINCLFVSVRADKRKQTHITTDFYFVNYGVFVRAPCCYQRTRRCQLILYIFQVAAGCYGEWVSVCVFSAEKCNKLRDRAYTHDCVQQQQFSLKYFKRYESST